MITFIWKGVQVSAEKLAHGWVGPPDCPLHRFPNEYQAAARLLGEIVDHKHKTGEREEWQLAR